MEKGSSYTRLKVFQVIQSLEVGGAENFTCQLANELSKFNHITIITTKKYDSNPNFDKILNSKIKYINLSWKKKYSFFQFIQLYKIINEQKPDVVHVHLHNSFYYVFLCSIFIRKINYVHTIHSSFEVWKPIINVIYKLRFLSNNIVHVALSNSIKEKFKSSFKKIKITKISNGIYPIDTSKINEIEAINSIKSLCHNKNNSSILLLAIGNIAPLKNYSLLAKALKAINDNRINCVIIGKHISQELVNEINVIGYDKMHLLGFKENAAHYLYYADALVISSHQEGMPLVALEAMSLGKPIISTPVGSLPELIINNKTGFLSKDNTVSEYSNAIKNFINLSDARRSEMIKAVKEHFTKEYFIEQVALNYNNLYLNGLDIK